MTLKDLKPSDLAIITKVKGRGAFRKRILEMGFVSGQKIEVLKEAPLKDPVEYRIMGYDVSLRNSEADLIEVVSAKNGAVKNGSFEGTIESDELKKNAREKSKTINVVLVGNPNSGKTTIFNHASGSQERVGNYGGVTVDAKAGKFKQAGYKFNIIDLPGTYSISAYSPEELYVRDYILLHQPDVVVNVLDSSNLERNLYLTTQLIDMDIKVVAALNMYDELEKKGDKFDYKKLGIMLGIPFIPTIGSKGKGIEELFKKIIDVYEDRDKTLRHIHINYGMCIEKGIDRIQEEIYKGENHYLTNKISSRFLAIKLLESDKAARDELEKCSNKTEILDIVDDRVRIIEEDTKEDSEALITDSRYGFISGALKEVFRPGAEERIKRSEIIDTLLTHKLWGIPIFLFFMWLTFYATFMFGQYPVDWIETGVAYTSELVQYLVPDGIIKDLLVDGVIGGVGGVIVFLPNILILYFFISLMEDTGYMARAVFIMDKAMHKIGLHGKSFIPMLMGFGCNVPAIMSARIIESPWDRLVTMLINPFMSCSARLPVYVLFISAFFSDYRAWILFALYFIGVLLAIGSAWLLKKTMFKSEDLPFVMELPPYRFPTIKSVFKHMWFRAQHYLKKAGGVILVASIIIWALGYFPRSADYSKDYSAIKNNIEFKYENKIERADSEKTISLLKKEKEEEINSVEIQKEAERQEQSYIGMLGSAVTPIMKPLGFDWKMTISVISGVAAKEVVVGTLGVLYQIAPEESSGSLVEKLRNSQHLTGEFKGQKVFTPLKALSFMLFILIYFPCIGVITVIKKESGSWKWPVFSLTYTTLLAWFVSFSFYQIGNLFFSG